MTNQFWKGYCLGIMTPFAVFFGLIATIACAQRVWEIFFPPKKVAKTLVETPPPPVVGAGANQEPSS